MRWQHFDQERFHKGLVVRKLTNDTIPILRGFDQDPKMVKAALENLSRLKVKMDSEVSLETSSLSNPKT